MSKTKVARPPVDHDAPLTLEDLQVVSVDGKDHPRHQSLSECALLMRYGGFSELWWDLNGLAEIMADLFDADEPPPISQLRYLSASLRAILHDVDPMSVSTDHARACRVEIRRQAPPVKAVA